MMDLDFLEPSLRDENIIWTVAKNYNFSPKMDLVKKTGIASLDYYRLILFGKLYEDKNSERILAYCIHKSLVTKKVGVFYELMMLTLEELFLPALQTEYSGIREIEREAVAQTLRFYDKKRKREDVLHEIRYAYYMDKDGVAKTNTRVMDLIVDIHRFRSLKSEEYVVALDELMAKHFHFEKTQESISLPESEKNTPEKESNRLLLGGRVKEVAPEEIMSAEFSQVDIGKTLQLMDKDLADKPLAGASDAQRIYRRIIESYGKATVYGKRLIELEKKFSVGIHEGEKLHITDRFTEIEGYKRELLERQREENMEHFDYMSRVYRRNINRLVETLHRSITADMDYSPSKLDNGMIMSGHIWRQSVLGDGKVFYKNFRDTKGEFVVDILLDASGSQIERQSLVSAQAYIIAEALARVGIACRVSSFNNLFDYMIVKIYRDYHDASVKNRNIFSYQAEGSNRDGLAISLIGSMLLEKTQEHKILIVLSDGKPNDERAAGTFNLVAGSTKDYTGTLAVDDTAQQVRILRAHGIAVLGVFTGRDEDLTAQRRIFGQDFAYISRLERFSDIVGTYLRKQIDFILES